VLFPRATHCAAKKIIYISLPLLLGFLIFLSFQFFKELEKELKNVMLQRRNECLKNTSSRHKEHTNAQSKETCAGKGH
jgi:hypothetical protein